MTELHSSIKKATMRSLCITPGHCTYGIWINGGKCGDLTLRVEEMLGFERMMRDAGFTITHDRITRITAMHAITKMAKDYLEADAAESDADKLISSIAAVLEAVHKDKVPDKGPK
jgi:hypothetical protein